MHCLVSDCLDVVYEEFDLLSFSSIAHFDVVPVVNEVERLRARSVLLEFLKFRVLSAGPEFFDDLTPLDRRQWLTVVHPQSLCLSDQDLDQIWNQARFLYTEI